jgi:hypothetical protein
MSEAEAIQCAEFHTSHKRQNIAAAVQALRQLTAEERKIVQRSVNTGNPNILNRYIAKYRDALYRNLSL